MKRVVAEAQTKEKGIHDEDTRETVSRDDIGPACCAHHVGSRVHRMGVRQPEAGSPTLPHQYRRNSRIGCIR